MVYNQGFVPGWNSLYKNLINKITRTYISANVYTSPFSAFVQSMEVGEYQEDIHINPSAIYLQDTITNSDIFTDYTDDIATAFYKVNIDLVYASTYREYVVRAGFTLLENVSELITALTANLSNTLQIHRTNLVKQMLYNSYHYGMIDASVIDDPLASAENSGKFVVELNTIIDDFRTEVNKRNVIYNNQVGITEAEKRQTIATEIPYIIIFNKYIRDAEFLTALQLGVVERFTSGNSNMDFEKRLIFLNLDDFPTSIPPTNRSAVTGDNVPAIDINFFEMPTSDIDGTPLFSGEPLGGSEICAMIMEPEALKLVTQLSIATSFLNTATLKNTNREIYRGIMDMAAFKKIRFVTFNPETGAESLKETTNIKLSDDQINELSQKIFKYIENNVENISEISKEEVKEIANEVTKEEVKAIKKK